MMTPESNAIIRSLCFHEAWNYAPTRVELCSMLDVGSTRSLVREDVVRTLDELLSSGIVREIDGRIGFPDSLDRIVQTLRERDLLQSRKRRRAILVTKWLVRLSGVRFVALANTTALGNARDEGDLDFFIITKKGMIWSSRFFGGAPFKLIGWMPTNENSRDAVCLSYFITDDGLDLSSHQLTPDDPYFRHWFLSLLPLYDDGVSEQFWSQNAELRQRHPFAEKWIVPPDLAVQKPGITKPTFLAEPLARWFQMRWFPQSIRNRMNRDTTVMVNDKALKFHVTDSRVEYRAKYIEACDKHGIDV